MVYFNELKMYKQTQFSNSKSRSTSLQHFDTSGSTKSLPQVIVPYVKEYCQESSVHCLHYLTSAKLQSYQKAVWLLIIAATSAGAIYVYVQLADMYKTQRIQTTVADSVNPVFFIPFPSVGICLRNRLDWQRLPEAQKRFLYANASTESMDTFRRFFEVMEDFRFGRFSQLSTLFNSTTLPMNNTTPLALIDNVRIVDVMQFLALRCEDIFETGGCLWRRKVYDCCELFNLERTESGYCYVFNSVIDTKQKDRAKRDKFYPYHNAKAGERSGLQVIIKLDKSNIRPGLTGVNVMVKQPEQWSNDVRHVNHNTYTKIAVTPQLTETDNRARNVPPDIRRCFFEDERNHRMYKKIPGLRYWHGNCVTRCHQEYILKSCNCSLSLLFPNTTRDNFTECRPSDLKCVYDHHTVFSSEHHEFESEYVDDIGNAGMICNCFNSCSQLLFALSFTSIALEGINSSDNVDRVHLDVYFQSPYFIKYRTGIHLTFIELLASFGGIIGLFLGASLLSAVELGYFLTIGLYSYMRKEAGWFRHKRTNGAKRVEVKGTTPIITLGKLNRRGMTKANNGMTISPEQWQKLHI